MICRNKIIEAKFNSCSACKGVEYFDHFGEVNEMIKRAQYLFDVGGPNSWYGVVFLNEYVQMKNRLKNMKKGSCNVASFATSYNTPPRLASMAAHLGGLFVFSTSAWASIKLIFLI